MSILLKRGKKIVGNVSIKRKSHYLSVFYLSLVAIKEFKIKKPYDELNEEEEKKVRDFIRNLAIKKDLTNIEKIQEEIIKSFLDKESIKVLENNLDNIHSKFE